MSSQAVLSAVHPDVWQPLPTRGRILFRLSHAVGFGITGTLAGIGLGVLASAFNQPIWAGPVAGIVIGVLFGAWLGGRRHGYYRWKLDDEGFAVKSGKLWQSETHVPASRVQHLDIKRGPLERSRGLATLIVHTAGTRGHALSLPCLDDGDAESLRTELARRVEPEGDDD